jgi:Uma2 family endonuclease
MLTYEIHGRVPSGILTSADVPFIDLNVPFEIRGGELLILPPPSAWHDATSSTIRNYLGTRHAHAAQDMIVTLGANGRRPDVVGLSVSLDELLAARAKSLPQEVVQVAVEVISHDDDPVKDRESVARDREVKFHEYATAGIPEYWIVDEVSGTPHDASVEIYRLQGTSYVPVTVIRLSKLVAQGPDAGT